MTQNLFKLAASAITAVRSALTSYNRERRKPTATQENFRKHYGKAFKTAEEERLYRAARRNVNRLATSILYTPSFTAAQPA